MLSRDDLHPYQERAVDFIVEKERCGLFLDLGLGKTVSTLTAVSDLIGSGIASRVLVIAPLRVANSVWAQESALWSHLKHLRVSVCTGSPRARAAALHRSADVFVINRENIVWLAGHCGSKWPFDTVVVDESSSFKNSQSKRFRALRKMLPYIERMVLLTGTPSPNGLIDLWAQMYLIDYGQALGRTLTNYRQRFFDPDFMGYSWSPKDGSEEKIHRLIEDKVIHMSSEDYLDLPDRIDLVHKVSMPEKVKAAYLDFEKTMLAELEDGEEVEAATAAVLANKMLQWANGAIITDEKGNWQETHKAKLDALQEIVEDNSGESILVAYNYRSDLARIRAKFPEARVLDKDQSTIDDWNAGRIKMLVASPASAGHGLNLQRGGSICVWFGLNWSLELYQQFNARLHRQGQTKPVRIVHLVAEGTIDERVVSVLRDKGAVQGRLLDALKPD